MPTRYEGIRVATSVAFAAALLAMAPAASAQSAPEPAAAPAAPLAPASAEPAYAPPVEQPPPAPAQPARTGKPTSAGEQPRTVGVLLRLNFDFGGDSITTVTWTDGNTKDIKAAQLFTIAGGLYYHPAAPYALEATLGYKSDGASESNGDITFWRVPFDVVASFAPGRHRIGLGPTIHLSPTFSCNATGGVCGIGTWEAKYDTAVGGIVQYAYGYPIGRNSGVELALRYSVIEYKGAGLVTKNGSGAGFLFGAWF